MYAKSIFIVAVIICTAVSGCNEREEITKTAEVETDLLHDEFSEAKEEIRLTMDSIVQSAKSGDLDRLIGFHAYGPKFTEFKNGEVRNGDKENEKFEREVFGSVTEISKFDLNDMKIAVYGEVANVTLHTDFHLKFGEDAVVVNDQLTLLFLRTDKGWRVVHEHHSPMTKT